MSIISAVALFLLAQAPLVPSAVEGRVSAPSTATAAFDQLKALVGTWRSAANPASSLRIRFTLTAGGTVLVESWEAAGKPHSLTLYHRDGAALIATHYCPQGNQPRLKLTPAQGPRLAFTFRDATGLSPGESHLDNLAFDLTDPQRPVRTETYRQSKEAETTTLTLTRTEAGSSPMSAPAAQAEAEIRAQRTAFNAAIAAGQVEPIAAILADNVQMITGSDSIHVAGKQAHLDRWAEGFKDPNRLVYIRTTDKVTVSPLLPIALEYGHWRGAPAGSDKDWVGGDYTAKWRRVDGVWRVEVETYVTTGCGGSGCLSMRLSNLTLRSFARAREPESGSDK